MQQKTIFGLFLGLVFASATHAQNKVLDKTVTLKNTSRIIRTLAADDMQGRKTNTPGIKKAAAFIAKEFKKAGLQSIEKDGGFYQSFILVNSQPKIEKLEANGELLDSKKAILISTQPQIKIDEHSGFVVTSIKPTDNFFAAVMQNVQAKENRLVLVNEKFAKMFPRLTRLQRNQFASTKSTLFLLMNELPKSYSLAANNQLTKESLANLVGIIPGKTKKQEYVVFSAHYDHLGIDGANKTDSIYNGANDDASGVTAVIQLAKYYAKMHNNERTLIFATFTGEEIGGFGAKYFSRQLIPAQVMAMFNIEMIGTESKWGKNSAYITGYDKTNMGELLQQNLRTTHFKFYPDPYIKQQLFYRSDNATLAKLGVPAHTISTSKMDAEPNYHKVSDEVSTLNLANMNQIIKAIALSAKGIVAGKETPTRVDTSTLR